VHTTVSEHASQRQHILDRPIDDPKEYAKHYEKLCEFVSGSTLDNYKLELEQVLYPIFVHCFLELISKHHQQEARTFFNRFVADHEVLHKPDLCALQGVQNPQHLKSNEKAARFRDNKFGLRMSEETFMQLRKTLQDERLTTILFIINRHLNIEVFAGELPVGGVEQVELGATLTGFEFDSKKAEEDLNKSEIKWGSLETPAVATRRSEIKAGASGAAANEDTGDAEKGTAGQAEASRKRLREDSALNKEEGCPLADEDSTIKMEARNDPNCKMVPLPPIADQQWQEELEELRKSVKLSCKALPSVCCYTVLNTDASLSCLEVCGRTHLAAAGFDDSLIRLWDLKSENKKQRASAEGGSQEEAPPGHRLMVGHSGPVYAAHFSPCNRFLLSASEDKSARLWSAETGSCLVAYKGHNYPVWDCKFCPLGIYFATASHDRTARIWSTDHIHPLRILAGHLSDVDCVAWHPNCNYLATGSSDKTLRLWDINEGKCVRLFTGHKGTIYAAAISADGRHLASAGEDQTIKVWDLAEGKLLKTLEGHTDVVWSLDFSREGSILASGGADSTVRLWDVSRQEASKEVVEGWESPCGLMRTLPAKQTPISLVRFSSRNILLAGGAFQQAVT